MNTKLYGKTTGQVIRATRKYYRKNQMELSRILNVNQSTVSRLERGQLLPDHHSWVSFCKYFKVPADAYLTGLFKVGNPSPWVSGIKIHSKYLRDAKETVETVLPLILVAVENMGQQNFEAFLKARYIDPDYLAILNNPINDLFRTELLSEVTPYIQTDLIETLSPQVA